MKRHFTLLIALLCLAGPAARMARAEGPDEKYIWIYTLLQEADGLLDKGQPRDAVRRYLDARTALKELQTANPGWNQKLVSFRLGYIASKLEPLGPEAVATNAPAGTATNAVAASDANPVKSLQDEITRLTAQNLQLQDKLKEAWAAQPAASDPRELTKAQAEIKSLQKERDLLKVSLEQEQARSAKAMDAGLAELEKKVLAEAKEKIARQEAALAALQVENENLRKQIGEMRSGTPALAPNSDFAEQLRVAQATIAVLQSTNIALRTDQILMEKKFEELSKQLKESAGRPATPAERDKQLEIALAKVQVYEAKPLPYTAEELALFKQPDARASVIETNAPKRKVQELPAGAGPLIAEAQRALEAGRYAEAEKKYAQVLSQDDKNVFTLGNLAAVQMEQNRWSDAESNLKQALAIDGQDPASLYLMGRLKLQQEKYDDALDALSLSAKILPEEPRTQYYLGKVLVQKGQRVQAEAALRKAVQLRPGWGEAHYSLAMVYATQQPPFKELAQWHYQRARDGGYPRNPDFEKMLEEKKPANPAP